MWLRVVCGAEAEGVCPAPVWCFALGRSYGDGSCPEPERGERQRIGGGGEREDGKKGGGNEREAERAGGWSGEEKERAEGERRRERVRESIGNGKELAQSHNLAFVCAL